MVISTLKKSMIVLSALVFVSGAVAMEQQTCANYAKTHKLNLTVGALTTAGVAYGAGQLAWNYGGAVVKATAKSTASMVYNHPFISLGIVGAGWFAYKRLPANMQRGPLLGLKGINFVGEKVCAGAKWSFGKLWAPIAQKIEAYKRSKKN